MGRRRAHGKHTRPPRPLADSWARVETAHGSEWMVRSVPADRALKAYRCPGCSQTIRVGLPHVVVWPREAAWTSASAIDERRHWHTGCWRRRGTGA